MKVGKPTENKNNQINIIYSTPYVPENVKFSSLDKKGHSNSIDKTKVKMQNTPKIDLTKNIKNLITQVEKPDRQERPSTSKTKSNTSVPQYILEYIFIVIYTKYLILKLKLNTLEQVSLFQKSPF